MTHINPDSEIEETYTEAYLYELARKEDWNNFLTSLREYMELNKHQWQLEALRTPYTNGMFNKMGEAYYLNLTNQDTKEEIE